MSSRGQTSHSCVTLSDLSRSSFCLCVTVSDDVDLNSVASIPGMGIPEQLKAAMEQEQSSESQPGMSWNVLELCCRFPGSREHR